MSQPSAPGHQVPDSVSGAAAAPDSEPHPPVREVLPVHSLGQKLAAEAIGTFVLVFAVVGTALFAAGYAGGDGGLGVGFLGVAIALGLSVLVGAFAFGGVSGAHFNPAVTIGLATAGRFPWPGVPAYLAAQALGGIGASSVLAAIAAGLPGDTLDTAMSGGFVSTGWGDLSPTKATLPAVLLIEVVATAIFVCVVLGATSASAPTGFAPIAIGLTLTLLALVAIPISDASFNPARSLATAVWGGRVALGQLWLSILAPTVGAIIAGLMFRFLFDRRPESEGR